MEFLQEWGYLGLFVGSFLAATVVPFSADILTLGVLIADGSYSTTFIAGTVGSWLGSVTSFGLGWLGKWEWIERWFKVKEETLLKQKDKIDRYGAWLALLCWTPFVGDVFAIGLGFYKSSPIKTCTFMLIGKALRSIFWIVLFHYLGENISFILHN